MTWHLDDWLLCGRDGQFSVNSTQKDCREHCKTPQWRCWFGDSQSLRWRWKFGGLNNTKFKRDMQDCLHNDKRRAVSFVAQLQSCDTWHTRWCSKYVEALLRSAINQYTIHSGGITKWSIVVSFFYKFKVIVVYDYNHTVFLEYCIMMLIHKS